MTLRAKDATASASWTSSTVGPSSTTSGPDSVTSTSTGTDVGKVSTMNLVVSSSVYDPTGRSRGMGLLMLSVPPDTGAMNWIWTGWSLEIKRVPDWFVTTIWSDLARKPEFPDGAKKDP